MFIFVDKKLFLSLKKWRKKTFLRGKCSSQKKRILIKTSIFEYNFALLKSPIAEPVEVPYAQPYFGDLSGGGNHLFYGDEYVYCPFG